MIQSYSFHNPRAFPMAYATFETTAQKTVAACLYMEWLEKHHYQGIMGREVIWVRYVEDVLAVVPKI